MPPNKASHLDAIYYPFSRCLDEETLKRAILLYDHLIFVDPKTPKVRQGLYSVKNHQAYLPDDAAQKLSKEWDYIEEHYDLLCKEGVVSFFDPSNMLEQQSIDQLITDNLQADMSSQEVFGLFKTCPPTWSILRSRIPKTAFGYLHHQYTPRVLYHENVDKPFSAIDSKYHALFADGKPEQDYSVPGDHARSQREVPEEFACVVPYYLGSSLSVSLALAISSETGAILFTDSEAHHKLLSVRFQRAAVAQEQSPFGEIPGLKAKVLPGAVQKKHLVELRLMDTILSAEDLRAITVEECLKYRERTTKEREEFRKLLSDLTERIEHDPWSPDIEKELQQEIKKIQSAIEDQKASMRKAYQDLFSKAAIALAIGAAPLLLNTIFPGITAATAFIFGAGATSGLLAEPLKDLATLWAGNLSKKNSLAYLLNLKKVAK